MNADFEDEWYGWRLRGRHLVSQDGQRLTVERLRGLMWRDAMELAGRLRVQAQGRRSAARARQYGPKVKVLVIDLADYREHGVAAS
jgi:hypothetical protein